MKYCFSKSTGEREGELFQKFLRRLDAERLCASRSGEANYNPQADFGRALDSSGSDIRNSVRSVAYVSIPPADTAPRVGIKVLSTQSCSRMAEV